MSYRLKLWLYIMTAGSIVLTLAGIVVNSLGQSISLVFAIGATYLIIDFGRWLFGRK
jgi:hypothetical protein